MRRESDQVGVHVQAVCAEGGVEAVMSYFYYYFPLLLGLMRRY